MQYQDFEIRIRPDRHTGHAVHVLASPAGDGVGEFRLPISLDRLGALRSWLRGTVPGGSDGHRFAERTEVSIEHARDGTGGSRHFAPTAEEPAVPAETPPFSSPQALGQALFEALFPAELIPLYERSLEKANGVTDGGLRLLLKIDPACPDTARLHSLPWELLFRPLKQHFMSLNRRSPLVRLVDVPEPPEPPPAASRLQVLALMSSPRDLPALDLRREQSKIEHGVGARPDVRVEIVENGTLATLRRHLLEGEFHVLHFMGHGGFSPETGEGILFFTGEDGSAHPIRGQALAQALHDFESLRLVFLNACETASASFGEGLNPFAGVANSLLLAGVPAVVAMQLPISDPAAIAFSETFYRRLAQGDPVDAAVTEGRQSVHADPDSWEWATPVLFASAPELRIYRPQPESPPRPRRWLAAAIVALLLASGLFGLSRTTVAQTELELAFRASKVAFTLDERLPVIDRLPLQGLAVSDLEEIRLPVRHARGPRHRAVGSGARGQTLVLHTEPVFEPSSAEPTRRASSITLEETFLPAGSRILLDVAGEREVLLALQNVEEDISLSLEGTLRLQLPPAPAETISLSSPAALSFRPRRSETDLHLTLFPLEGGEFHPSLAIRDLSFLSIEEIVDPVATRVEEVSTVRAGSLEIGSEKIHHAVEEREKIRLQDSRGTLSITLHDDHVETRFRGRVSGVSSEPEGGEARDLMPTLLEVWGNTALAILAAGAALVALLLRTPDLLPPPHRIFRRRRAVEAGRSPRTRQRPFSLTRTIKKRLETS